MLVPLRLFCAEVTVGAEGKMYMTFAAALRAAAEKITAGAVCLMISPKRNAWDSEIFCV